MNCSFQGLRVSLTTPTRSLLINASNQSCRENPQHDCIFLRFSLILSLSLSLSFHFLSFHTRFSSSHSSFTIIDYTTVFSSRLNENSPFQVYCLMFQSFSVFFSFLVKILFKLVCLKHIHTPIHLELVFEYCFQIVFVYFVENFQMEIIF